MKKTFLSSIIVCLFSLLALFNAKAQAITLVKNGQPKAQIVISKTASSTEQYVAEDLQRVLQEMSGATLPINNTIPESTFAIVIGTPQSVPAIKSANLLNTDDPQTVRIATRGKVLFLTGNTPGSALRAVYTFLQDELHCRWYWPGESGEYLLTKNTITIDYLNITETPAIRNRTLAIGVQHWNRDALIWMSRNHMNLYNLDRWRMTNERIAEIHQKGLEATLGGHSIILPPEILKKHPEYRALYAGERQGSQLCWGNPEVQEAVAQEIKDWWEKYPELDSIEFLAADTMHYCQDDLCKAMAPDVSTRWQKFCQIVIDKVHQDYPEKRYWLLAYQGYSKVPDWTASSFDFTALAVYYIDYTKPITAPQNKESREKLTAWQKVSGNVAFRGYQFVPFREALYAPLEPLIVQEIAWAHQHGLKGWYSEVTAPGIPEDAAPQDQRWTANRMSLYAVSQALWNADVDASAITQDWTTRIYGAAAQPMLDYYQDMQQAWVNSPQDLRHFANVPAAFVDSFISNDLLVEASHHFKAARENISKLDNDDAKERILRQINLEAAMLNNWRKIYSLQQGLPARFKTKAPQVTVTPQVTAAANDPSWKNIPALPGFENANLQTSEDATKVLLQWDDEAMYLRFVNQGTPLPDGERQGEGNDAIQLLLSNPADPHHYYRIAIDAKNNTHCAKIDAAMNEGKAWNPQFSSKTSTGKNSWILDVKLPFQQFGITSKEGISWEMAFKRGATGWPDASRHNPTAFGTVTLVNTISEPKKLAFYNAQDSTNDALLVTLRKAGFVAQGIATPELDKSTFNADALIINVPESTKDTTALDAAMKSSIIPFVKNGGMLMLTGYYDYPVEQWFGQDAAVEWNSVRSLPRKSTFMKPGDWQTVPNDLREILSKQTTPLYGYTPLSDKWDVLVKMPLKDGSENAYLSQLKMGKGKIILTTSNFGYGGGWEMFGERRIGNTPLLMENLLQMK